MRGWSISLLLLLSISLYGQNKSILSTQFNGNESGQSLIQFLEDLKDDKSFKVFYLEEWLEGISINKNYEGQALSEVLDDLFQGTKLEFIEVYPSVLVIIKNPEADIRVRESLVQALVQNKKVESYSVGTKDPSIKGEFDISGQVFDWSNGTPLSFVSININDTLTTSITNDQGRFNIRLSAGSYVLRMNLLSYEEKVIDLTVNGPGDLILELEQESRQLDEIVVQAERVEDIAKSKIGRTILSIQDIKRAPSFLGEVDLVKQVQTLPGVTTVGEAATGFNVRGGSVDQNLILYDGLPIFNSSHVFGFLTAFNPEAVENVEFFKGGIPSTYGGRISSVLDISAKEGDFEKPKINLGIGMITSNAMYEGPIKKGISSVAASVRSTYSNWLVRSVRTDYANLEESDVGFFDATLKLTHKFSDDSKISFTSYASRDAFRLDGDSTYRWSNLQFSGRFNKQLKDNLGLQITLGRSAYGYEVENSNVRQASELSYEIATTALNSGFFLEKPNHNINFGWQLSHYRFKPGAIKPTSERSSAANFSLDNQYSLESALYIDDEWTINDRLTLQAGLRFSQFFSFGPADVFLYQEGVPRELSTITDTLRFEGGDLIESYMGLEPRLSLNWDLGNEASFKFGYNRVFQYLHLVTNTAAVTPVDIWQPSGYYFEPQRADQVSLGLFKNLNEKKYGLSLEGYYKFIDNLLDFKDGARLILNTHIESELLQGTGEAYGVEAAINKNTGKLTGSLSYTYSRAFRTISGPTANESINGGNKYPANFDQPHVLNLNWKIGLSKRHFFTGNFIYHTGRPVTIPLAAFGFEGNTFAFFSRRNQFRVADYHRLDVALVIEGNHKRDQRWKGTWVLSLYNVYARNNPYTVFFRSSQNSIPEPFQLSIVGTIFPSISYNLKFE